jgi:ubiquinone/menaquinone biosynthesis C-methylase UbiE
MHEPGPPVTPPFRPPIYSLIERFPELFDGDGTPRRGFAARHSRIDEFAGRGNQPPVIVKTITVSSSPEHAARVAGREFEALTWLHARVDGALRDTIPEPLAWIPGSPALAMRKVNGVTVNRLLRRNATRGALWGNGRLTTIGAQIGGWLRALHDATRSPDTALDGTRLFEEIEAALQIAASHGLAPQEADHVREAARGAVRRVAGTPVPHAARQGDFTVSNILIDGPRVRMVDFENFDESDAVYEDLASLVGYLRMLASSPAYSPARLERLRSAFLRGYGQPEADPVLALYELKHALTVLAQFPAHLSLVRRWRRRAVQQGVVALAAQVDVEVVDYHAGAGDYRDAAEYDARRYRGRANEYKRRVMKAAYTSLVGTTPGRRLLDVGCGTGRGLADLRETGARLFGSDASVDMLARASAACPDRRPGLTAAHAQHLPFRAASFDLVISLNFLHLFSVETQRQMVIEMKRVLKPGGRLILEFDNALHGGLVGPWKRWTGRERGILPGEIRRVLGDDCRVVRRRGAVYPIVWRWLARWPSVGEPLEKLGYLPGVCWLTHRMYYELLKPAG